MTREEAIKKIERFGLHHAKNELPYSVLTVEAFEMAIQALQAEPCEDAISRKHFDERVRLAGGMADEELTQDFKDGVLTVLEMLKTEPSVTPQKVGKWINKGFGYAECPFCGFGEGGAFVFKCCPSCCAKMEKGEENSNAYITD